MKDARKTSEKELVTGGRYTFAILFTFCYSDFVVNNPAKLEMEKKLQVEEQLRKYFGSVPVHLEVRLAVDHLQGMS